jgi:hypothetical protein
MVQTASLAHQILGVMNSRKGVNTVSAIFLDRWDKLVIRKLGSVAVRKDMLADDVTIVRRATTTIQVVNVVVVICVAQHS